LYNNIVTNVLVLSIVLFLNFKKTIIR